MKKLLLLYCIVALFATCTVSCTGNDEDQPSPYKKIELSDETRAVVTNANEFAFDYFTKVSTDIGDENVVISPLSVTTALSMLANGDKGESREAILKMFGFAENPEGLDRLNEYSKVLLENLPIVDSSTKCGLANSVWSGSHSLVPDFEAAMKNVYNAESKNVSPTGVEGQNAINFWIEDKTNGVIRDFIKEPLMCDFAVINAIYFKGKWKEQFDEDATRKEEFSNIDGSKSEVEMMHLTQKSIDCSVDDNAILATLKYGNGNFEMVAILPVNKDGFDDLIVNLKERYTEMLENCHFYTVDVSFPKFSSSSKFDAIGYLTDMGLHPESEFNSIYNEPLYINMILTGVSVSMDEHGTEAAAVTMPGMVTAPGRLYNLEFNRPFIYLIRETSTGAILFMGKVVKF